MRHSRLSALTVALLAANLGILVGCDRGPQTAAPHRIVLIVIDTLRADALPFYGYPENTAPFLTELSERSLVFEKAWAASSWTGPSTASIFTSLYPNQHGVEVGLHQKTDDGKPIKTSINRLPDSIETIPVFMKRMGYATFGLSNNQSVGERLGFDRFELIPYLKSDGAPEVLAKLLEWKPEILGQERSFLYIHFMDPHSPYLRYEPWRSQESYDPPEMMADRKSYDLEIALVDEAIAALFEEFSLQDDAVVMVTADHGQEFRDHGGVGHFFQIYSELTHVPLLLHVGGRSDMVGRVSRNVSLLDILPTLRALVGAPPSDRDEGVSLLASRENTDPDTRAIYAMRIKPDPMREKHSVIRGTLKLIVSEPDSEGELYDLASDPGEKENLLMSRRRKVKQLRALLEEQKRTVDPSLHSKQETFEPTAEELRELEALGYVEEIR